MFGTVTQDTVRTCLLAGAAIGMLFSAVSAYAVTAHQPAPPPKRPMFDHLLRQDDPLAALRQELLGRHAQGGNASSVLAWMQEGGFFCDASLAAPGAYDCTYRRQLMFGQVAELQARIVTSGTLLSAVVAPPALRVPAEIPNPTAQLALGQRGG